MGRATLDVVLSSLVLIAALWLAARWLYAPAQGTLDELRARMVREQIEMRGISEGRVLEAMRRVERHRFVPPYLVRMAYNDTPLPIGEGQTISQPYIVAFMTEKLDPRPSDRVLEIGTGSGYQAAVLAGLVKDVYTIEIVRSLGQEAARRLQAMGLANVHVRVGDGYKGWPERAPFDGVIVTCAPDDVPAALVEQLAEGGRMVIPVGPEGGPQELYRLRKVQGRLEREAVLPVAFVPMVRGR